MSLLDQGTEKLLVFREIDGEDDLGNKIRVVDRANPVTVYGSMTPSGSSETDEQNASTFYTFRGRTFPGGAIAQVEWVNRNGWEFDVQGDPGRRTRSRTTRHATVLMKARTAEPLED